MAPCVSPPIVLETAPFVLWLPVVAASEMAPAVPTSWYPAFVGPPPSWYQGGSVWPIRHGDCDTYHFHSRAKRKLGLLPCSLLGPSLWGLPVVMWRGHYRSSMKRSSDEERRPPAESHVREPWWQGTLQPQSSLEMTATLINISMANSRKTLSRPHLRCFQIPKLQELCEIINVGCCL